MFEVTTLEPMIFQKYSTQSKWDLFDLNCTFALNEKTLINDGPSCPAKCLQYILEENTTVTCWEGNLLVLGKFLFLMMIQRELKICGFAHGKRTQQFARSRQWRHAPCVCVRLTATLWRSRAHS